MKDAKLAKVQVQVVKTDSKLGLVFGYAIVCKTRNADGELEDYYDTGSYDDTDDTVYSDHITEEAMLAGVTEFMKSQRIATDEHERDGDGDDAKPVASGVVVHSFPLTADIATALGITVEKTGWLVAMQPEAAMLKRFVDGDLRQFSIGGKAVRQKDAA